MLPIIGPLLTIGTSLVSKLFGNSSLEKEAITNKLKELADLGDVDQLKAEVQQLALLAKSDEKQAEISHDLVKGGGGKWRDHLGLMGVLTMGFNFLGITMFNMGVKITNGLMDKHIETLQYMDIEQLIVLAGAITGVGLPMRLSKKAKDSYSSPPINNLDDFIIKP